jgi:hypothetical protein
LEANQPLFANPAGELKRTADGEAHLCWRPGPRHEDDFKDLMEAFLVLVRQLGTGKALVDQRDLAPLSAGEQDWMQRHWLPRAVVQGRYTYAAVLPPRNPAAQASLDAAWQPHVTLPLVRLFADEEAANEWLRQQIVIYSQL